MKTLMLAALFALVACGSPSENVQRAVISGGYQTEVGKCYVAALEVDSLKLYKECKAGVDARFGLTDGGVE